MQIANFIIMYVKHTLCNINFVKINFAKCMLYVYALKILI